MDKETFYPFRMMLIEISNKLKEAFSNAVQIDEYIQHIQADVEKTKVIRSTWSIKRDTRVDSQVVNNKPRHLIKKII